MSAAEKLPPFELKLMKPAKITREEMALLKLMLSPEWEKFRDPQYDQFMQSKYEELVDTEKTRDLKRWEKYLREYQRKILDPLECRWRRIREKMEKEIA